MPCRDGCESKPDFAVEAMLCALCRSLNAKGKLQTTLATVDWDKAGVRLHEFQTWWAEHQANDREEERRIAKEAKVRQTRLDALAKLTKKEREALGYSR